jgi:hypothetical protein
MPLPITVTRDVFVAETRRGGPMAYIGWDSAKMDNVCAALVPYHAAIGAVAEDPPPPQRRAAGVSGHQRQPPENANRDPHTRGVAVGFGYIANRRTKTGMEQDFVFKRPWCGANSRNTGEECAGDAQFFR